MQYAVFDLFGGTTELFDNQYDALAAAERLLAHYRSPDFRNAWQEPPYATEIVVMRATHRAVQVVAAKRQNSADCLASCDYRMEPVAAGFLTQG